MIDYVVRYTLDGLVYETTVRTSSPNAAMHWVKKLFSHAQAITVVGPNE